MNGLADFPTIVSRKRFALSLRVARQIEIESLDLEDLHIYLHNLAIEADKAAARSGCFAGRLVNWLTYGDPVYVDMIGARLRETLAVLNIKVSDQIDDAQTYSLRRDLVSRARDLSLSMLEIEGKAT